MMKSKKYEARYYTASRHKTFVRPDTEAVIMFRCEKQGPKHGRCCKYHGLGEVWYKCVVCQWIGNVCMMTEGSLVIRNIFKSFILSTWNRLMLFRVTDSSCITSFATIHVHNTMNDVVVMSATSFLTTLFFWTSLPPSLRPSSLKALSWSKSFSLPPSLEKTSWWYSSLSLFFRYHSTHFHHIDFFRRLRYEHLRRRFCLHQLCCPYYHYRLRLGNYRLHHRHHRLVHHCSYYWHQKRHSYSLFY